MSKYTPLIKSYCRVVDIENEQMSEDNGVVYEYNTIKLEVERLLDIKCPTPLLHNTRRRKLLVLSEDLDSSYLKAEKVDKARRSWKSFNERPTVKAIEKIKEQLTLDKINCEDNLTISELIFLSDNEIVNRSLYEKVIYAETNRRANLVPFRDMQCFYDSDSDRMLREDNQIFDNPPPLVNELSIELSSDYFREKFIIPKRTLIRK